MRICVCVSDCVCVVKGITGNMGDFLLKLDALGEGRYTEGGVLQDDSDVEEGGGFGGHLLDDSDQELTDISEEEGGEDSEGGEGGESEEEGGEEGEDSEKEGEEEEEGEDSEEAHVYRPVKGEDIYGRVVDSGQKYVPPARRALPSDQAQGSGVIDDV